MVTPEPNFQTKISIPALVGWLVMLQQGDWSWTKNTQCKYVDFRIDTRHGVYSVTDRDGNEISFEQLLHQFGVDEPEKLS